MFKLSVLLSFAVILLAVEISGQRIILPTYRPPPRKPIIIRTIRDVSNAETEWSNKSNDVIRAPATEYRPILPKYIDDIRLDPNRRYARSVDSPSAKRGGGSSTRSSGNHDTGATHPGSNRRNARSIRLPEIIPPNKPMRPRNPFEPRLPTGPFNPNPRPMYPIYARTARDIHIAGIKKPTHRDVIIPNWNPNARIKPWQKIGVKSN